MELGSFQVYFVQYKSNAGHWHTRQWAFGNPTDAYRDAQEYTAIYDCETRVVKQTTENKVV